MENKICSKCKTEKSTEEFYKRKGEIGSWCKECEKSQQRERVLRTVRILPDCKTCKVCKKEKLAKDFYKTLRIHDGLSNTCKVCSIKRQLEIHVNHGKRRYVCIPLFKKCGKCKRILLSGEFGTHFNRFDGLRAMCKVCDSEESRKWRENNPEKQAHQSNLKRARKLQRTAKWADIYEIKQFYKNRPKGMAVDHIIPLQGELASGLHVENNLQYLTRESNSSKWNKFKPYRQVGNDIYFIED